MSDHDAAQFSAYNLRKNEWIGAGDEHVTVRSVQVIMVIGLGLRIFVQTIPLLVITLSLLLLRVQMGSAVDGSLYTSLRDSIELGFGAFIFFGGRTLEGFYKRITRVGKKEEVTDNL